MINTKHCPRCTGVLASTGEGGRLACSLCSYREPVLPESFANHPPSVTEIRSQKTDQSNAWTPRDALIDLLRAIDSGEMEVTALVVSVAVNLSDGVGHAYRVAAPDQFTALGLLARASFRIQDSD